MRALRRYALAVDFLFCACALNLSARIKCIAQAIADKVDEEHRERDEQAGEEPYHHTGGLRCIWLSAWLIMLPQLAVGGSCTPRPRNETYASDVIAPTRPSVADTMIGASVFGTRCRNKI